jgi:hypothetical protein
VVVVVVRVVVVVALALEAPQRQRQLQARRLPFRLVVVERRHQHQQLAEGLALVVLPRQLPLRLLLLPFQEAWEGLVWEVPHHHPELPSPPLSMPRLGLLQRLEQQQQETWRKHCRHLALEVEATEHLQPEQQQQQLFLRLV